jgi:formylmethanofuran dehydrogenase subunit A
MTRAGPAKALGLANIYGGLKPGMDADVAVYNFNPDKSHKPDEIEKAFSAAAFVMKAGTPVVIDGEVVSNGNKRTLWVDMKVDENPQVMRDIQEKFLKYYSMTMNNYDVASHFLTNPRVIEVNAAR